MYTFQFLKLRSYWTESHQIYTQCREIIAPNFARCSQIIADDLFEIRIAIFQSVLEC